MLAPQDLQWRSDLLQAVRRFFLDQAYIEVDTPCRLPVLLPETNIFPFQSEDWFLQPSPEQCMKRLLAGGAERIFQICHCFRKEELGRLHEPEFTLLEWYHKAWDYQDLMRECEHLLPFLAAACASMPGFDHTGKLCYQGKTISLEAPWERLSVCEALHRYANADASTLLARDTFDEVLVTLVEPHLGQERPTFLYDYPRELGSLARCRQDAPEYAERFELYIAGIELANGFSELCDVAEQKMRFNAALEEIAQRDRAMGCDDPTVQKAQKIQKMPEKFLAELPAMGESAGIALGLDRLFMLFAGKTTLQEAICFSSAEL